MITRHGHPAVVNHIHQDTLTPRGYVVVHRDYLVIKPRDTPVAVTTP